jgi:hypothetical protein
MNIYKFPFDSQICRINIGSWFQSNKNIKILISQAISNPLYSPDYIKNPLWKLKTVDSIIQNSTRVSKEYIIEEVSFLATIERQPLYYMINNVYPCLILNMVTLVTYFLPFTLQASLSKYLHNLII